MNTYIHIRIYYILERSVFMMKDIKIKYFDHAATTPVREEVLKEMLPFFSIEYGNASAAYRLGRNSKRAIELARSRVAKAIGIFSK